METCQRTIHLTNDWGKAGKRKCGKKATHKQQDGLPICEHHYNKLQKKLIKILLKTRQDEKQSIKLSGNNVTYK